jgi:predicted RNA methylase
MDAEAWFEVTPENIAEHVANRLRSKKVVHDCCSGVGGNSIQFALKGMRVTAVDLNPSRLAMLRSNASIYGVERNIATVNRDLVDYLYNQPDLRDKGQVFFISPPWGGEAANTKSQIEVDGLPINLRLILPLALRKFGSCVLHLPKQSVLDDVISILRDEGVGYVEIESIYYTKPVRHLKCHFIYVDSIPPLSDCLLIGPTYFRLQQLLPFLYSDRFSPIYTDALLKVNYVGRYISRHLNSLRIQTAIGGVGVANVGQDEQALLRGVFCGQGPHGRPTR